MRKSSAAAGLSQWDRRDSANGRVRGRHTGRSAKQGNLNIGNSFITEKVSSIKKCNTSHFCTVNRLHVQATHPGLCSAATALLSAWMVQETGKAGKDLEIEKFLREKKQFLPRSSELIISFLSARGGTTLPVLQEGRCSLWCKPQAVVAQH